MTDHLKNTTEQEFIEEHERLEDVLKATAYSRKKQMTDKLQFKNRLLDLFEIALLNANENPKLITAILKKTPQIINRLCISSKFNFLNTARIISLVQKFVESLEVKALVENHKEIDEVLGTIFNIMVYKKSKQNLKPLLKIVFGLLKVENAKIKKVLVKNLDILMNFIQRGKNIDKVLFSFEKILDMSQEIFKLKFEELMNVLAKTKNRFFIEHFLDYCSSYFQKNRIEGDDFSVILDKHILSIYNNLKTNKLIDEEKTDKKEKKVRGKLVKLIKSLNNTDKETYGNMRMILGKLE